MRAGLQRYSAAYSVRSQWAANAARCSLTESPVTGKGASLAGLCEGWRRREEADHEGSRQDAVLKQRQPEVSLWRRMSNVSTRCL